MKGWLNMAIKWPEIQYREGADGMLYPLLEYPQQPSGSIGKYGELRRNHLEKHRPATYQLLILNGELKQHLMDVNKQAHEQIDLIIAAMLKDAPAPDKTTDQLGWVQHMNMLKAQAEEILLREWLYS